MLSRHRVLLGHIHSLQHMCVLLVILLVLRARVMLIIVHLAYWDSSIYPTSVMPTAQQEITNQLPQ